MLRIKYFLIGALFALLLPVGALFALWYLNSDHRPVYREQKLPSGETIKVTSFYLTWGVEHEERLPDRDSFALEYISSRPGMEEAAVDLETIAAFELIRPAAELWGFTTASVAAFPTEQRKGRYNQYTFRRTEGSTWHSEKQQLKVFVND